MPQPSTASAPFWSAALLLRPRPRSRGYVDGEEIRQSQEFRMTSTADGWYRLVIEDTMIEDEGEYTVKAVNEAGTCISTAYLTVLRKLSLA
jgi:hypothetical protein